MEDLPYLGEKWREDPKDLPYLVDLPYLEDLPYLGEKRREDPKDPIHGGLP